MQVLLISANKRDLPQLQFSHAVQYSCQDTDGLVLQNQGISSHSADYAPMRFPVFKG